MTLVSTNQSHICTIVMIPTENLADVTLASEETDENDDHDGPFYPDHLDGSDDHNDYDESYLVEIIVAGDICFIDDFYDISWSLVLLTYIPGLSYPVPMIGAANAVAGIVGVMTATWKSFPLGKCFVFISVFCILYCVFV